MASKSKQKPTPKAASRRPAKKVAKPAKPSTGSRTVSKPAGKKALAKGAKRPAAKAPPIADVKFDMRNKIQRQKEVAWRLIDGEAVIITPSDSTMHSLNESGTRIWELINGNRTLGEVAEAVQVEFDVDADRARKDTLWFVECLAKKGLVEIS
jgi:hypothetical protein